MEERQKAVLRFKDGRVLKGHIREFSPVLGEVVLEEQLTAEPHAVAVDDMKAVFFVRSFEGVPDYREKKAYGLASPQGRQRVFVRFSDGESLVGFLEGDTPWEKGFFLSKKESALKGFFLTPVDGDTNNIKVFVIASSVHDVTVVP